jgi:putative ABC transport system permease protein
MSSAFEVNLSALSMLALVVGLFLIYNTMTFSVVQRRPLFGILRSIGVTRREVFSIVVVEAFVIGVLGSATGILLGIILGQGAIKLVTRTINDLFFVLTVRGVQIPTLSLVKGFTLGVAAAVVTSAPPAWEAASVPPRLALSRSGLESKAGQAIIIAASLGLLLLISGIFILLIPTRNLVISFTGTFAVVIGAAMLTPLATRWLIRLSGPPLGRLWGSLGRMAPRSVINSLSRTSIAVAALMVAVSVTIGVSLMVGSFRSTVIIWLDQTLQGDIYISSPGISTTQTSVPIVEETLPIISNWDGVREIFTLRSVEVGSEYGQTHIAASSNPLVSTERIFQKTAIPPEEIPRAMTDGAILVSEPYANRVNIGGNLTSVALATDQGLIEFPVVAIYYDYSSTQGSVLMSLDTYRKYWNDNAITAVAAILEPGASPETIARQLRNRLANIQNLEIRPNSLLRSEVLDVFDRTFAITTALQLLATSVAFIGILSALLSLELERQRELGILRAIGLTSRQLWRLILLETGLLGSVAGILSMPTGYVLAVILIFIINRRSFGWTLQMQVLPEPFLQAFLIAISAALLAGIYPALRMSRTLASEAMRAE